MRPGDELKQKFIENPLNMDTFMERLKVYKINRVNINEMGYTDMYGLSNIEEKKILLNEDNQTYQDIDMLLRTVIQQYLDNEMDIFKYLSLEGESMDRYLNLATNAFVFSNPNIYKVLELYLDKE